MTRRRVRALRGGEFEIRLPAEERALLAALPRQLAVALEELPDEAEAPEPLRRLFPPAYLRDEQAEASYGSVMRPELATHHREALETMLETANRTRLDAASLESWLTALNDLRLVLGTSLGVTEDVGVIEPSDPRFQEWAVYGYLSFLQGEIVDALSGTLPAPVPGAGDDLPEDPWGEPLGDLRWDGTERPPPGGSSGG